MSEVRDVEDYILDKLCDIEYLLDKKLSDIKNAILNTRPQKVIGEKGEDGNGEGDK
jgi:hypothetical protein